MRGRLLDICSGSLVSDRVRVKLEDGSWVSRKLSCRMNFRFCVLV